VVDSNVFWLALGLVFVIEGLFPFVSPAGWRRMFFQVLRLNDGQIRFFALCSLLGGSIVIWWIVA
jgi:uncharacterized protein YjeT (DUF2065 family)